MSQDVLKREDGSDRHTTNNSVLKEKRQYNLGIPYQKIDREVFETMLEYLSQEEDGKIISSIF